MGKLRDVQGLADYLGVSKDTVYTWVEGRVIPCTRIGRLIRFTDEQVAEIVAAGEQRPIDLASPLTRRGAA